MILEYLTLNDIKVEVGHEFWPRLGEFVVISIGKNLRYVMLGISGCKYILTVNLFF